MSTSSLGPLGPVSEGQRFRPALPGESRSEGPRSTCCPGQLGPMPNVPWGRPAVPGDSGPGQTYRGVDQVSRATRTRARGPTWWTSCPGELGTVPEASRIRPEVPGHSGPCLKPHGVDQHTQATRVRVREPAGSSSCPGCLALASEGLQGPPAFAGDSGPARGPAGWTSSFGGFGTVPEGPWCRTAFPAISRLGLRVPGVDQRSRPTLARVRVHVWSTCGPGRLGPEPYGPRR